MSVRKSWSKCVPKMKICLHVDMSEEEGDLLRHKVEYATCMQSKIRYDNYDSSVNLHVKVLSFECQHPVNLGRNVG